MMTPSSDSDAPDPGSAVTVPSSTETAWPRLSSGRRKGVMVGSVAAALLVTGGAFAATGAFGGGGGQPADVLPGAAFGYARMDLNPSAGQKVAAFRLLDKLPNAKQALLDEDPKKSLFELIKKDNAALKDIDYTTDVEPWLGDRLGLAVLPPSGDNKQPIPVVAVAVKDEAKAEAGLQKLQRAKALNLSATRAGDPAETLLRAGLPSSSGSLSTPRTSESVTSGASTSDREESSHFFRDGFMVITTKTDETMVRDAVNTETLSGKAEFDADMKAVGDHGVLSGWIDQATLAKVSATSTPDAQAVGGLSELMTLAGRQAFAVRFTADYLEAGIFSRGNPLQHPMTPVKEVTNLPAGTAGFLSFSDGDVAFGRLWERLLPQLRQSIPDTDKQLADFEARTRLKIPQDVQTLLGKQFDFVVSEQRMQDVPDVPKMGVRVTTDTSKAEAVLDKIKALMAQGGQRQADIPQKSKDGRFFVAVDSTYLDELTKGGNLSENPSLGPALADAGRSFSTLFADLDKLEPIYLHTVAQNRREFVKGLKAVGYTTVPAEDGSMGTLRLLAN